MLSKFLVGLVCAAAVMVGAAPGTAAAQPLDKRVYFEFSAPVTLPGVVLPKGKYLFRLPNAMTSRNLVQVLSEDGTKIYGTFFAIPARRPVVPEQPEVRFMETPSTMIHAIRTWWYPGDSTGFEFIYPKDQATRLAKGVGQPVLTTQADTTTAAQTDTPDLTRISETGMETAVDASAQPVAATPTGTMSGGEVASPTLVIPSHPVPVNVDSE